MRKKKRLLTATQIRAASREGIFNPKTTNIMQFVLELASQDYCVNKALEILHEIREPGTINQVKETKLRQVMRLLNIAMAMQQRK